MGVTLVPQQPVGHRETHHEIVGELAPLREEREIGGFDVVEFVYRSDGVSYYCS